MKNPVSKPSGSAPVLSAVFVTFEGRLPFVERLMKSLCPYPSQFLEIIAVDNKSCPNASEWLKTNFPCVTTFRNRENIGTAKAYNIGIDLSKGRYLMLINDDCCLEEKAAHRAVHFLETHPEFVGIGFSLLDLDGIRRPMKLHLYPFWPSSLDRPHRITFVGTNNLLCRREAFQSVGLFDENYFFFNEDLDWSWRARKIGLKFYYDPQFRIRHLYRLFSEKPPFNLEKYFTKIIADLYFYRKNMPVLFDFVKAFYKVSLRHNLKRIRKIGLYPQLKVLLRVERPKVLSNIYDVQKTLMNGSITDLLSLLENTDLSSC